MVGNGYLVAFFNSKMRLKMRASAVALRPLPFGRGARGHCVLAPAFACACDRMTDPAPDGGACAAQGEGGPGGGFRGEAGAAGRDPPRAGRGAAATGGGAPRGGGTARGPPCRPTSRSQGGARLGRCATRNTPPTYGGCRAARLPAAMAMQVLLPAHSARTPRATGHRRRATSAACACRLGAACGRGCCTTRTTRR